jgi:hypothetical protein
MTMYDPENPQHLAYLEQHRAAMSAWRAPASYLPRLRARASGRDAMSDTFSEIAPMPERAYQGMTHLYRDGRTYACMGVGNAVREALVARADRDEVKL